eukprot:31066-Pelagococcus_subviridis.AAC.4
MDDEAMTSSRTRAVSSFVSNSQHNAHPSVSRVLRRRPSRHFFYLGAFYTSECRGGVERRQLKLIGVDVGD